VAHVPARIQERKADAKRVSFEYPSNKLVDGMGNAKAGAHFSHWCRFG